MKDLRDLTDYGGWRVPFAARARFRFQGLGFRVQGSEFRVEG